jgi:hypothetical protein
MAVSRANWPKRYALSFALDDYALHNATDRGL